MASLLEIAENIHLTDRKLFPIWDKVQEGRRITNIEGLDVVIRNMETFLSENNIKPIEAIGAIFDPKLHEAVSTIDDNSLDEGTITQEVAKGYISFQDVIRPSKVIVSKKNKEE